MAALRADYFGTSSFGTIMAFSSLLVILGMSSGPTFAGYLADIYGNYRLAFSALAFSALTRGVFFALAQPHKRPLY